MTHDTKRYAGNEGATGATTSAPAVAGLIPKKFKGSIRGAETLAEAEWIRLPKPGGRDRLTGLSRTTLVELGDRKAIRVVRLRKPGALRGIVLVHKQSLLDHLASLDPKGEATEPRKDDAI